MRCQAYQYNDQMMCARCALAWDVNDPEPPECQPSLPDAGNLTETTVKKKSKDKGTKPKKC